MNTIWEWTSDNVRKFKNHIFDTYEDAEIIFGTVVDEEMGDEIKVTVIATGLGGSTTRVSVNTYQKNRSTKAKRRINPTF